MGVSTRGVLAVGVTCAGRREGTVWSVLKVLVVAAARQVRSWGKSTHGQRWPEGCTRSHRVLRKGRAVPSQVLKGCIAQLW